MIDRALAVQIGQKVLAHVHQYMGTQELLPDGSVNPFVTDCFAHTSYHTKLNEPWCAAFGCRVYEEQGYKSPHSAAALDMRNMGVEWPMVAGAGVVLEHLDGPLKGHFHWTFLERDVQENDQVILGTGGNQNNMVCTKTFSLESFKIIAVRGPESL